MMCLRKGKRRLGPKSEGASTEERADESALHLGNTVLLSEGNETSIVSQPVE